MLLKQTTPTFIFHYCNVIDETIYTRINAHYVKTHNIEFWQFTDLFTHISVKLKVLMDNRVHKYSLTVEHTSRHLSKAGSNHIWAQCLCSWHCARYLTQSCCPERCSWTPHSCLLTHVLVTLHSTQGLWKAFFTTLAYWVRWHPPPRTLMRSQRPHSLTSGRCISMKRTVSQDSTNKEIRKCEQPQIVWLFVSPLSQAFWSSHPSAFPCSAPPLLWLTWQFPNTSNVRPKTPSCVCSTFWISQANWIHCVYLLPILPPPLCVCVHHMWMFLYTSNMGIIFLLKWSFSRA